jgi:Peptidase family M28
LLLFAVFAVLLLLPPTLTPGPGAAGEFSVDRALSHVRKIASEPRPVGSPGHAKTRAYLIDTLTRLGLEVREQPTHFASLVAGNLVASDVHNVIGRLRGSGAARGAVLLAAHYDSVPAGPGASDDGFGVAVLLETARALTALPKMPHDVLFLFSDAEEEGLLGAQAFVADSTARAEIGVALNFDARGTHGAVTMFDTSAHNAALIRALGVASPHPIASSFISTLAAALPNDTDASVFKRAGIPTYSFAYADGLEHYHRFSDTPSAMDPRSLAHGGSYALSMARYFASADLAELTRKDADNVVYFDLLGRGLVRYSKLAARLFAAATLLLLWLMLHRARAGGLTLPRALRAAGEAALAILAAMLVAVALQLVLLQFIPFYFSLARVKIFVPGILAASSAVVVLLFGRRVRAHGRAELASGGALLFAALLSTLAVLMPELSAPFQWPLAFALLGVLSARFLARSELIAELTRFASLIPACFLLTQMAYATLVAAGATMAFVPMVFVGLLLTLLLPAIEGLTQARARRVALVLGVFALVLLSVGALTCHYGPNEPSAGSLDYGLDLDSGKAVWFTRDAMPDARVAARIPAGAARVPLPAFTRSDQALLATPAPAITRLAARVAVSKNEATENGRLLELTIQASADARCWQLWQEPSSGAPSIVDERIDGAPVSKFVRFSPELDAKLMRAVTGDTSRLGWHMTQCGAAARPVALGLRLRGRGALVLRLLERVDGLPLSPFTGPSANAGLTLGPAQDSDVSLVSRTLEL